MRFLRSLFQQHLAHKAPLSQPQAQPHRRAFTTSRMMSGASTSASLYVATVSLSVPATSAPDDVSKKAHHNPEGKGFRNPWDSYRDFTPRGIGMAMLRHRWSGNANSPDTSANMVPPVKTPQFLPGRETKALRATWLGHACYYIEFPGGLRVLVDPVFSQRCSPFQWLGPKRYTKAPCQVEDIPLIDIVVLSHNHYDHMDYPTIMKINESHPNVHFFTPLANKKFLVDWKISPDRVTELDWWDQCDLSLSENKSPAGASVKVEAAQTDLASKGSEIRARLGCLPAQHMSARTAFDKANSLWSSWSIESGGKKLWFGGDTGYRAVPLDPLPKDEDDYGEGHNYPHCPAFKEIGDLRGPFDLGLIPIGAYAPRHVMSPMHANPFDSVNIFKDTKCKRAMGIHWGTWVLTEEDVLEPPKKLKEALQRSNIPETGVFDVCDIGESREFD